MRFLATLLCTAGLLGCSGKSTMPPGFNEACYGGSFNKNLAGVQPVYSAKLTIDRPSQQVLRELLFELARHHELVAFDDGATYNQAFFSVYLCSAAGAFAYIDSRAAGQNSMHVDVFCFRGGDQAQNWLILKNGSTIIGLFQGMFERNILTFNPGWDNDAKQLPEFTDVLDLQRDLKAQGVQLLSEADEATSGPASFMVEDPDGNQILVDQHV